ncbi:MAG: TadE/TadG family type IV pilus assembly protein [Paenibacillaceae bacterium]
MNNERGIISLEAAIVIPFFLTLIIGLLILIRIAFVQIALQNAADEAVKQFASILYPLEPSIQQAVSTKDEWLNSFLAWVPDVIIPTIETLLTDRLNESLTQPAMNRLFKPIYWHYVEQSYKNSLIRYDQLNIEFVSIPFINNDVSMFGIEVRYEFRLSLPFYQRTILIRKRAYERVWFGA